MRQWGNALLRTVLTFGLLGVAALSAQSPATRDASLQERLQQLVSQWQPSSGAPGVSVGLVTRDGVVHAATAGLADRATKTPLATDDLMLAGSTGKTFFAALAVQLIEEKRLSLDQKVSMYLGKRPWFNRLPNADAITIRHLMTHTSGLVRYEMNPAFTADLRAQPDRVWKPEEQLAYLFDTKAAFLPGEGWDYSDTNYIVLAMVLEAVTGTKAYEEIRRRFLGPLKLTQVVDQTSRVIPGLVQGYAGAKDPIGLPDEVIRDGRFVINPQFEWGGGGFATSARDLARWGHELYRGNALSPASRSLMIESAVPARLGPETRYGLGVIVRPTTPVGPVVGHSGFFPGYLTELVHTRDSGVTVAVQVNTSAGVRGLLRFAYDIASLAK
jgi:D-alanyl-D-alanine carboxypeptidase